MPCTEQAHLGQQLYCCYSLCHVSRKQDTHLMYLNKGNVKRGVPIMNATEVVGTGDVA